MYRSKIFPSVFALSLALLQVCSQTTDLDPVIRQKVNNYIDNVFRPANGNTSVSLAIVDNGTVLYATGYGFMDVESEVEANNKTTYLVGSIAKSFTAAVIVKALHETFPEMGIEKVLDTPIRKLAPQVNFTLNDRYRSEQTTFRDMLSHRVCAEADFIALLSVPFDNAQEVAFRQRYANESCAFRTGFVYNNGIYTLASTVIEAITGESFGNMLTNLFKEIGMEDTSFVQKEDPDLPPNRAIPYYVKDGKLHRYNPVLMKRVAHATAAGGVVSNAVDMAKYMQFHLNKGKVGDRQVIPENVMESMYKIASVTDLYPTSYKPAGDDYRFGYGLGHFIGAIDGWKRISHAGSMPPFLADMEFFPGMNLGIFTATNQMPLSHLFAQKAMHNELLQILKNVSIPAPATAMADNEPESESAKEDGNEMEEDAQEAKVVKLDEKQMNELVGSYGNGLQGEIDISLKFFDTTNSNELYMTYGKYGRAYLVEPDEDLKFRMILDSDIIQDQYASGNPIDLYIQFKDNGSSLTYWDGPKNSGSFRKDVHLDGLPAVPWSTESCGPDV